MNIKSPLLKAELWTKLKTIRDDKKIRRWFMPNGVLR